MSHLRIGTHSSLPTMRTGSAANSFHMSSYGNPNSACSLGSATLLQPRQSSYAPLSPLGNASQQLQQNYGRRPIAVSTISAIDTASTKLSIPISAVEPTLAFEDDGLVPGLCRLYLEGRCRQGERCFQVHADPAVVAQLRSEAYSNPSCCPVHGAKCKLQGFPLGLAVVIDPPREREGPNFGDGKGERESASTNDDSSNGETSTPANGADTRDGKEKDTEHKAVIMLHNLCPTRYLWTRYEETGSMLIHVPKSKICREHRKGLCRFGDECSFLHVCRQIPLAGSNEELFGHNHSRTLSRVPQGSASDFGSHPPSFAAASGSLQQHGLHTCSPSHSMANTTPHCQNNILLPHNGSFAEGSFGGNAAAGTDHTRQPQPLLRPLGRAPSTPHVSTMGQGHGSFSTASSMHARGFFSHNPYAEASSFQS
ncbi:Zinc finger C-x8-C-x5-C-x3-H type (and similar) [Lotmaria passim]